MKQMIYVMTIGAVAVAPPRGARGLKHTDREGQLIVARVAPPRGARGLKHCNYDEVAS